MSAVREARCRLKAALRSLMKQGLSRRKLALTLALGVTLGVLPTVWGTTLACALIATALRLNQVVIQLANYLSYPLQILLFVPFVQLGQRLFGPSPTSMAFGDLLAGFQHDPGGTLQSLGGANLKAIGAWTLLAPLMTLGLYLLFVEFLRLKAGKTKPDSHE